MYDVFGERTSGFPKVYKVVPVSSDLSATREVVRVFYTKGYCGIIVFRYLLRPIDSIRHILRNVYCHKVNTVHSFVKRHLTGHID